MTKSTSEPKAKKRLPAAVPGTGGRFYRDADGNNLKSESEHMSLKKGASDNAKGATKS
ncbi:hypothetical protein FM038_25875 [Shewanella eurypsychrophilus]|uniref:Uncharacterized protein n=1 Tax=Shewanella eurypsychrophilus TaxID=2593656 RepID=A0ABX8S565_9GAMM|nr:MULTISPECIES: hypothetical protein [Shewanella]QXP44881.1 hypothetical protein FM038_25875 [Shewanella eurypsychrophilus]